MLRWRDPQELVLKHNLESINGQSVEPFKILYTRTRTNKKRGFF